MSTHPNVYPLVLMLTLILFPSQGYSQEDSSFRFPVAPAPATQSEPVFTDPREVLKQAKVLQEKGRSDKALEVLERGKRLFPWVPEIRIALGDLFAEREVYQLALLAYQEAEALSSDTVEIWNRIAVTYGKLGQEDLAVQYYERIHARRPDSLDAVADLGWVYFKTHQLKRGKVLLEAAVKRFGTDRRLSMTLGTICAGLYQYEEAKRYYRLAIQDALYKRDSRFASVAYYNLSILEKSFNHYEEALSATEHSLSLEPRAPGYLSLGDLYEGRMDFTLAESAYLKAQQVDETPLSRLSLANLYRKFGHLEKALALGKELLEQSDYAWMYYFGTSKDRHLMDIHELLRDTYRGLANLESFKPKRGAGEALASLFHRLRYHILAQFHTIAYRMYAERVAEAYRKEENLLNAAFTYKRALESYPPRALHYLEQAEKLELALNPEAARFYLLERGKLQKDLSLLTQATELFINPWERENLEDALVHRARLLSEKLKITRLLPPFLTPSGWSTEALEKDFKKTIFQIQQINPGALGQNGLKVPTAP